MMPRLTKMEWHIINDALALLEVTPADYADESAAEEFERAIGVVRDKVWAKIADGYEERDRRYRAQYGDPAR